MPSACCTGRRHSCRRGACAARPWCSPRPKARRSCRRSFRRRASRGRTRRASALRSMRWAWSSTGCSNCSCGRCRASTTRRSRARWRSIKRWRIGSSRCFLRTSARRGDSRRCTAAPTSRRWEEPRCRSCCARARSWASSCTASAPAQRPRSPRTEGGRAARCSRTLTPPRAWCGSSSIATGRRGPMRSRPGRGARARRRAACGRALRTSWSRWSSAARRHGRWRPTSMRSHR